MNPFWILVVVLLIVAFVGAPGGPWSYPHPYGYWPSGGVGLLVLILIILLLVGRI